MQINHVIISGNLVSDPESRSTDGGLPVANFVVANNWDFKDPNGNKKSDVSFIKVVVFGKHAEACIRYLKKGSPVIVEGRVAQDRWEDEQGNKHTKTKIIGKSVQFVGQKSHEED